MTALEKIYLKQAQGVYKPQPDVDILLMYVAKARSMATYYSNDAFTKHEFQDHPEQMAIEYLELLEQ